jgi:hypothetical protein
MRDYSKNPLEVLSFGAGTQSTVMLIMAVEGRLPKPDLVVFADTGTEKEETYDHVKNWAIPYCEQNGIKFEMVSSDKGKLHEYYLKQRNIPMIGIAKCTMDFKIRPIRRRLRQIVGKKNGVPLVHCWIGITEDEKQRKHPSSVKWIVNKYPLIDEINLTRRQVISILHDREIKIGKSGCWLCPYQKKIGWMKLKGQKPELFDFAAKMEQATEERLRENDRTFHVGFLGEKVRLRNLAEIPDLWSFEDSNCDSGSCFI